MEKFGNARPIEWAVIPFYSLRVLGHRRCLRNFTMDAGWVRADERRGANLIGIGINAAGAAACLPLGFQRVGGGRATASPTPPPIDVLAWEVMVAYCRLTSLWDAAFGDGHGTDKKRRWGTRGDGIELEKSAMVGMGLGKGKEQWEYGFMVFKFDGSWSARLRHNLLVILFYGTKFESNLFKF
jgi:hypothetical protein